MATSTTFQPAAVHTAEAAETAGLPDYVHTALEEAEPQKPPVEVVDLTVRNPEELQQGVRVSSGSNAVDAPRPGLSEPIQSTSAAPARAQQWILADVFVESSEVTESGYVEYTLRASLRGDSARATATEVIAAARAVSPEVSVIAESLHFITKPGDELDSLSSDAIRIRVKGGLTFEPSMLRWTFTATSAGAGIDQQPQRTDDAAGGYGELLGPLPDSER